MTETERESPFKDRRERLASFQRSALLANDICMTFEELSAMGYYFDDSSSLIRCCCCAFAIHSDALTRMRLISEHGKVSPECENLSVTVSYETEQSSSDSGDDNGSFIDPFLVEQETQITEGTRESTMYMSQSDKRHKVESVKVPKHRGTSSDKTERGRIRNPFPTRGRSRPPVPVIIERSTTLSPVTNLGGRAGSNNGENNNSDQSTKRGSHSNDRKPVAKPICYRPEYDTYEERLSSFTDWPRSNPMRPEDLARAGFYYTHSGDKVKCPYCLGGVYNWEPTDDAFGEHVKHNPKCEYLKHYTHKAHNERVSIPKAFSNSNVTAENSAVHAILMLGFSADDIRQAIDNCVLQGNLLTTDNILYNIFELEQKQTFIINEEEVNPDLIEGAVGGIDNNYDNDARPLNNSSDVMVLNKEIKTGSETAMPQEPVRTVDNNVSGAAGENPIKATSTQQKPGLGRREHEKLFKENTCVACSIKPVNILYLPCRHLVNCEECAENIDTCPECGDEIVGTVKAFFT